IYGGPWKGRALAADFREMCRAELLPIRGNEIPDAILIESEYGEGKLSWFENRLSENPEEPWIEHVIDENIIFGHSLKAWRDDEGVIHIFVGEMSQGGFGAAYNHDARMLVYRSADNGKTWEKEEASRGQGTHEATACDIDGDGEVE